MSVGWINVQLYSSIHQQLKRPDTKEKHQLNLQEESQTNVGKDVEKREPSYTVCENVNWCSHCGKHMQVSQKWIRELPYNQEIQLLGIYIQIKWKY